ncbi:Flp pilus assembly protein CpaB [Methylobacterium sp. C25]|uniref:Flp pilus assembly protein CpaB n=1 Tax=Methylobacterium sp. C25 TaxID=2721622 RepID=UPI001F3C473E|nr:Flp pilus assembly protein CpaB [Methylobacterium sp. C25]MCE4225187.1 Flp pilus assembly protein CpaB [Methylobacterium sp. C25]
MKPARLAVLAIALVAGGGAAFLMSGDEAPPPPSPVAQAPALPTTDVLVAAADLPMGQTLKPEDLRWQSWPDQALAAGYVTRVNSPKALEETAGSMTRLNILANEPIRPEKLVKAGSGFMSAILPTGLRAVAVEIQRGGSTSAGGFVLPNDHVDVISIGKVGGGTTGEPIAQTILTDIRVLAVGQVVQERNGETVVTGDNATLALTPAQAEVVSLAQKTGAISLALRSIQDTGKTVDTASADATPEAGLTIVRFGVAQQQPRR